MSNRKRLVIAGAGGFGRELHAWVVTSPKFVSLVGVQSVVFIDDELNRTGLPAPVVSTIFDYSPEPDDLVLCAIGSPDVRRKVTVELLAKNAQFATFVHDSTVTGHDVELGTGVIICPNTVLTSNVSIGEHTQINAGCVVGHDVVVRSFVTISPSCNLTGGVSIDSGVFLGTAVTVIPGKTVGENAVIGAGSVVVKTVSPNSTNFGNPCIRIGVK
ncbi:acetyltransferase [Paeniglutamicibacter sp. ZC-3]|uniref:acetyltransferase n=1 Tax=Paeniglutamicibacter sp. ZC-3 TaxID=2986919 RepID=UPI003558B7EF